MGTETDLAHIFAHHAPDPKDVANYERIRNLARILAECILDTTPICADQSTAIRHLREAVMFANASIALGGRLHK